MDKESWYTKRVCQTELGERLYQELTGKRFRSEESVKRDLGLLPPEVPRSDIDKEDVRRKVDMLGLLERYGVENLRTFGKKAVGRCPFHTDKTASLSVDLEKKLWYCHACAEGSDVFGFIMRAENCSFRQALEMIA